MRARLRASGLAGPCDYCGEPAALLALCADLDTTTEQLDLFPREVP